MGHRGHGWVPPAVTSRYDGVAQRWATGASLVYGPLAVELVRRAPHALVDREVLDVGAGTGVGSAALREAGARPVAIDSSFDMVHWDRRERPPATVGSVEQLPIRSASVDDVYASFVLNHLADPVEAMRELVRVTRSGGSFLASTFSNDSRSAARDEIDVVAQRFGWEVPSWYTAMKADVVPLLGDRDSLQAAARLADLVDIDVDEVAVDVGVTRADQLVNYRLGQAHISAWLDVLPDARVAELHEAAVAAVEPVMEPYRPIVVFLRALVP